MATVYKSYKYRMYPNKAQEILLQKTFGCCRFVYNYFLARRKESHEKENKNLTFTQCSRELTALKTEYEWLREPDKCALQNALRDLDRAYQKFFKEHQGFPKFKAKKDRHHSYKSSYYNNNIRFLGNKAVLPKLGTVKLRGKGTPQGRILSAHITQECDGKYYVGFKCQDVEISELPKTGINVGIDLGITDYAVYSDGTRIQNPKFYEQQEKKLERLRRSLLRKTIGGANWAKTRLRIANLERKIANQRYDFLQKLSTEIVRSYDTICIEDLRIKPLKESPSAIRNKRICDASWYLFRNMLEYKCNWYGKKLVAIDRYYPSTRTCHVCGMVRDAIPESIRKWECSCGAVLDRDLNAAINILNEGLRIA